MPEWTPESGLRAQYPLIPWDEPLPVEIGDPASHGGVAFVCRYCVARHALSGIAVLRGEAGYASRDEAARHIREHSAAALDAARQPDRKD